MIMRTGVSVNYHIQMDMRTQIQTDLDLYILNFKESRSKWIWIFRASTASTPDLVCLSAYTLLVPD